MGLALLTGGRWWAKLVWLASGADLVWLAETGRTWVAVRFLQTHGQYPHWLVSPWDGCRGAHRDRRGRHRHHGVDRGHRDDPSLVVASRAAGSGEATSSLLAVGMVVAAVAGVAFGARALPSLAAVADPLGAPRLAPLSAGIEPGLVPAGASAHIASPLFLPAGATWTAFRTGALVVETVGAPSASDLGVERLPTWFPVGAGVRSASASVGVGHGVVASLILLPFRRGPAVARPDVGVAGHGTDGFERVVVMPASIALGSGPSATRSGWLDPAALRPATTRAEATARTLVDEAVTIPTREAPTHGRHWRSDDRHREQGGRGASPGRHRGDRR